MSRGFSRLSAFAGLLAMATGPAFSCSRSAPPTQPTAKETSDARALADKVIARYASAKTYRDRGTGSTETSTEPSVSKSLLDFHTAFRRDGGMLWSFSRSPVPGRPPEHPYVVWSTDLKSWNSWWALNGETKPNMDAGLAFGAPAGVSHDLSTIVPSLLGILRNGEDYFGFRFSGMRIVGTEVLGGVPCQMLEGRTVHFGDVNTLWIDDTGAIRRYRSRGTVDPSKAEPSKQMSAEEAVRMRARPKYEFVTEFNFEPVFDGQLNDEDTEFKPPADKQRP